MKRTIWLGILVGVLFLTGCAQKQYHFEYHKPRSALVWPKPPETPRYEFVGFISGERNFVEDQASLNFFNKSMDWLGKFIFGESKPRDLYRPQGGFFDKKNNRLYVTDIGHKAVYVFDLQKNQMQVWEQVDELNRFSSPIAIAVNHNNEVYISDSALGYVAKFDRNGSPLAKLGQDILQRPTGLAFDEKTKRLYVADAQAHQIVVFSAAGELAFKIGGKKSEQDGLFNSPTYLTIANEQLFVSDTLNARVQIFDLNGKWLKSFGQRGMYVGNLPRPKGVAVDSAQHIYVVESYYDHLLIFDEEGNPLLPIGGRGKQAGQFDLPTGVWVDLQDKIYVADMFNRRVSVFRYLNTN